MWNLLLNASGVLMESQNVNQLDENIDSILESSGYPKHGDIPILNRKVFKGQRVSIREHPYVASIRRQHAHYLVGTLLAKNVVVSVAHPLLNVPTTELGIVMGESYADRGGVIVTVVLVILHQLFDPYTLNADIALLRFFEDVNYRFSVKAIPLISYNAKLEGKAFVTGWGRCDTTGMELCLYRSSRYYPNERFDPMLRSISFTMNPMNDYCEGYKRQDVPLHEGMICTGPAREQDTVCPCLGVPGAPLVINARLVGLLSWGFGCGYGHDLPLVYTSMQMFSSWILHNIVRLGKINRYNLTDIFQATKASHLAEWLMKTRVNPVTLNIKKDKVIAPLAIDRELATLLGTVFDVRDFLDGGSFHVEKKNMYSNLLHGITNIEKLKAVRYNQERIPVKAFLSNDTLSDDESSTDVESSYYEESISVSSERKQHLMVQQDSSSGETDEQ